jgi:predicted transcriptional regulator of viral defense system
MREQVHADPVDLAIAGIAERQHGVIGYLQLRSLGLSRQSIDHRVRRGRLHRIHRGVYAVGHKRLTQRGRWMAAVLTGGDASHLSHRSASALWGILPARGRIHVSTPRRLRNRDGIDFHSQSLQLDEVTTHDGIATTTVARTLLDIAATEPDQLERAFNEAEYRRLWDATGVAKLVERYPRRAGAPALARLIESPAQGITREELEHRFHAFVEKFDLPKPLRNQPLQLEDSTIYPDAMWPDAKLIVELDSRAAHETTSRFDRDRERDRLLALEGWTPIRVTWNHLTTDPDRLATDLEKLTRR